MDLWSALGVSPKTALTLAAAGLLVAGLLAFVTFRRARRSDDETALRLGDRD